MRSVLKKVAAAVLAVVLAASLCGCDRGYIMTVDGMDIRNGVYLSFLRAAYSMASEELEKQKTDDDTSDDTSDDETSTVPLTQEDIGGKTGSQWIKDETLRNVRMFVAIQRQCDKLGLTLTDEEIREINSEINEMWDEESDYNMYVYGYKTMGEYYESQGVGQESLRELYRVDKLQDKLFMYFYGKGGEFEVPDSEVDDYMKENYAVVKVQGFSYTDALGNKLESDAEKKAVKDEAQGYADRINKGEKPVDIFYEYTLAYAQRAVEAEAETEYKEDNAKGLTKEEWIKEQIESLGITKLESDDDIDVFLSKVSTNFDKDTMEYIFNAPDDGKATLFDTENGVYLIIKEDITKKTVWREDNYDSILSDIKGDDFRNMVDLFGQNYEIVIDDESLVNKKYSPETLNA